MISPEETTATSKHDESRAPLPASTRIYIQGEIHPEVQVPMREITLSDTKAFNGRIEKNEAVLVYDCSGPWGDPDFRGTSEEGLPALRREWILKRGDVEAYDGREVQPQDNGYLTEKHAEFASKSERANRFVEFPGLTANRRKPLRAKGKPVTQKWYADNGIITPEMEFIAIRETPQEFSNVSHNVSPSKSLRNLYAVRWQRVARSSRSTSIILSVNR